MIGFIILHNKKRLQTTKRISCALPGVSNFSGILPADMDSMAMHSTLLVWDLYDDVDRNHQRGRALRDVEGCTVDVGS